MQTDSEQLLHQGIAAGAAAFDAFLSETGWTRGDIQKTFCHQVGSAHRKLLLQTLALDASIDFATYETLGNTGSVALPIAMALGIESGHLHSGDHVALLGIGSGINVLMLALDWQTSLVPRAAVCPAPKPFSPEPTATGAHSSSTLGIRRDHRRQV